MSQLDRVASIWNGRTRLILLVGGGLLTLQSSQTFSAWKFAYLIVVIAVGLSSISTVFAARHDPEVVVARPLIAASIGLLALIAVSLPVAMVHGTSVTNWLRDASTFGLFAVAPFVGIDAARDWKPDSVALLLIAAGLLSTTSFAVEWLQLRHIVNLGIGRLFYPSGLLGAALLTYSAAQALGSDHRRRWSIFGGIVFGLFLITGTRTSLVMVVGPVVVAVLMGRSRAMDSLRVLAAFAASSIGILTIFVVILLAAQLSARAEPIPSAAVGGSTSPAATGEAIHSGPPSLAPATPGATPRPDILVQHLGSAFTGLSGPGGESSLQDRLAQTAAAWNVVVANPLLGTGPGHAIQWVNYLGETRASYVLDTPLVFLAAFGFLGLLELIVWIGAFVLFAIRTSPARREAPAWLTWVGFGAVMLAGSVLTLAIEDKGSAFALAILLCLVLVEQRHALAPSSPARG
jgi:hypothetical protein